MSYLSKVHIDPHLKLLALGLVPEQNNSYKERIGSLMKTRRFDQLLKQVSNHPNQLSYPNLAKKIQVLKQKTTALKKELNEENLAEKIKQLDERSKNQDETKQVDQGQLKLYRLAKIYYDEGEYSKAHQIIYQLEGQVLNDQMWLQSTWARYYCELVLRKNESKKTVQRLKDKLTTLDEELNEDIKKKSGNRVSLVQKQYAQKQQLLNTICFAFFNNPTDEDLQKFLQICIQRSYFSVIQLTAPYMFRYMCAAMILNKVLQKNRNFDLFKLTEVINRGIVRYQNDVLIDFIKSVYIKFDFERASDQLKEIREDIQKDPFLAPLTERIIQNCQFLYYKVYCKVYESVQIENVAAFVGKTPEEAELWVLKYIRSGDIQAKIDATKGVIITTKDDEQENEKYIEVIPKINTFINNLSRTAVNEDEMALAQEN